MTSRLSGSVTIVLSPGGGTLLPHGPGPARPGAPGSEGAELPEVLIASDAPWIRQEVRSAILDPDVEVREVDSGRAVLPAVAERAPDVAVVDLQIGSMGAMAVALELDLEARAGRLPFVPVLMLLDRRADVFLARRSQVRGWVMKPLDPMRLRRAIMTILDGDTYYDDSFLPPTVTPGAEGRPPPVG